MIEFNGHDAAGRFRSGDGEQMKEKARPGGGPFDFPFFVLGVIAGVTRLGSTRPFAHDGHVSSARYVSAVGSDGTGDASLPCGAAAPAEKVAADASAACTARAVLISEMPGSSQACAPNVSSAMNTTRKQVIFRAPGLDSEHGLIL